MTVEERPVSVDELKEAFAAGQLKEAFGTGTAASIAPISELTIHDEHMVLPPVESWDVANWLKKEMNDIRYGRKADTHGWIYKV
jgi:branched-chain amino acid aminotransferase